MDERKKLISNAFIIAVPLTGKISIFLFVTFLFYSRSFGFIDMHMSEAAKHLWNGLLSIFFFVQHSGMIRKKFRTKLSNLIPPHYNDAVFTLASSFALTSVVIFWQPSSILHYEIHGFLRWIARGLFWGAIAGIVWGVAALKNFDPFGHKTIIHHLRKKPQTVQIFSLSGPYLWVRHPLYFFVLLLIWSYPEITSDRIMFNLLWSLWIIIGTLLEEKDLVNDFGDDYRRYQKEVPMLIPWKKPQKTTPPH